MQMPKMKMEWRGIKGNKYRTYVVINQDGKKYYHGENKQNAIRQYEASLRFYKKHKEARKGKSISSYIGWFKWVKNN